MYYSNLQQVHYKSYKDFSLALALPIEGFIWRIIQLKNPASLDLYNAAVSYQYLNQL